MGIYEALKYCLYYHGEDSIEDNPIMKNDDEFLWYMWRVEYVAVKQAIAENIKKDSIEEFMKEYIRCAIDVFCNEPFGGNPTEYYRRYFNGK